MKTTLNLKDLVREKYSEIALQDKSVNAASCCGAGGCCTTQDVANIMTDEYTDIQGYVADADLGLGCGLPTEFAKISPGDTVIDLGSGAGNDVFVARHQVGDAGKVIGIDFTPAMIDKARRNAETLGYVNVEFRQGDIENMPVSDSVADVVISNCVLNLVPNKPAVLSEIHRVLKPGGHFSISDIVLIGELPNDLRQAAEMYAGCVSGAVQKDDYLTAIVDAGFKNITIQKEKVITVPDEILSRFTVETVQAGIYSITVYAEK
jgi:SAM-dependent methyltransferase